MNCCRIVKCSIKFLLECCIVSLFCEMVLALTSVMKCTLECQFALHHYFTVYCLKLFMACSLSSLLRIPGFMSKNQIEHLLEFWLKAMPNRTRPMTALLVFTGLNVLLVSTITPVYDFICFHPYWERRVFSKITCKLFALFFSSCIQACYTYDKYALFCVGVYSHWHSYIV